MILIQVTYTASLEKIDQHLAAHRSFLKKYYDKNILIMSGRLEPRTGGMILANLNSKEQAQQLIQEDAFFIHNVASYNFIEWIPTLVCKELSSIVQV